MKKLQNINNFILRYRILVWGSRRRTSVSYLKNLTNWIAPKMPIKEGLDWDWSSVINLLRDLVVKMKYSMR